MGNEIYIDGVNVAGCKLYDYGICDSEQVEHLNREQNSDCYYKQLQRLKQENENLKEESRLFTLEAKKLVAQYSAKLEWQRKILQEIKEILTEAMDVKSNAYNHFSKIEEAIQKIAEYEVNE